MFLDIVHAYEIVSNEEKRRQYDLSGQTDDKETVSSEKSYNDHENNYKCIFKNGYFTYHYKPPPKQLYLDIVYTKHLSISDIYNGLTFELSVYRNRRCKKCNGIGCLSLNDIEICPLCLGRGNREYINKNENNEFISSFNYTCKYLYI